MEIISTFYPKLYLRLYKENGVGFRSVRRNPPAKTEITKGIIPEGALLLYDNLFRNCESLTDITKEKTQKSDSFEFLSAL